MIKLLIVYNEDISRISSYGETMECREVIELEEGTDIKEFLIRNRFKYGEGIIEAYIITEQIKIDEL